MDDSLHDPVVGDSLCGLPTFGQSEALRVHRSKSDTCRISLHTFCLDSWRGRARCDDLRNARELKGIRAEKPLRERGVIILFAEAGWGLFDRILFFNYLALHECSDKPAQSLKKSTVSPMS